MPSRVVPKPSGSVEPRRRRGCGAGPATRRRARARARARARDATPRIVTGPFGSNSPPGATLQPAALHGDRREALPGRVGVDVGEGDAGVGLRVGRERAHQRPREVAAALGDRGLERVAAVVVGREVAHPGERAGDVGDRGLGPAVALRGRRSERPRARCVGAGAPRRPGSAASPTPPRRRGRPALAGPAPASSVVRTTAVAIAGRSETSTNGSTPGSMVLGSAVGWRSLSRGTVAWGRTAAEPSHGPRLEHPRR